MVKRQLCEKRQIYFGLESDLKGYTGLYPVSTASLILRFLKYRIIFRISKKVKAVLTGYLPLFLMEIFKQEQSKLTDDVK